MNTAESFECQLKTMEQERQKLMGEIRSLKDEEEILVADLLKEEKKLQEEANGLHKKIWGYGNRIGRRKHFLQEWQRVIDRPRETAEFFGNFKKSKPCLRILKEVRDLLPVAQQERWSWRFLKMTVDVAEVNKVKAFFEKENILDQQKGEEAERIMQKKRLQIETVKNHLNLVKSRFKQEMLRKEKEDREFLEKIRAMQRLQMQPAKLGHGVVPCQPASHLPVNRKKKAKMPITVPQQTHEAKPLPWKFFVTFDEHDKGKLLPGGQGEFAGTIGAFLNKELSRLDPGLLYKKLAMITEKSSQQRYRMDQIRGKAFHGWKKLDVSATYRVLLHINEEKRTILFYPGTHDIFQKIWRS